MTENRGNTPPPKDLPPQNEPPREQLHPMVARWGFATEPKRDRKTGLPKRNEDVLLKLPEKGVVGVLDRVGSSTEANAAEFVSTFVSDKITRLRPDEAYTQDEMTRTLREMVLDAHHGYRTAYPDAKKGGTTLTLVKLWQGKAIFVHVGDSRGYIKRPDGELEQVTVDNDILDFGLREQTRAQELRTKLSNAQSMTDLDEQETIPWNQVIRIQRLVNGKMVKVNPVNISEQDLVHNYNVVGQTIGSGIANISVGISVVDAPAGTEILILTDGGSDNLTQGQLNADMQSPGSPKEKVTRIVGSAFAKSQEQWSLDNIRPAEDDISGIALEVA